jgi:hypothetical protein
MFTERKLIKYRVQKVATVPYSPGSKGSTFLISMALN